MVKMRIRGDKHNVKVTDSFYQKGWYGGQWVRYVGNRTVDEATDTTFAGFLLWGWRLKDLDAKPYDYIDTTAGAEFFPFQYENQAVNAYHETTLITDSGEMDFNRYVYDTTKNYLYNQKLFVNNNGILTNVDVGAPSVGIVVGIPQDNNGWLGMMLKF
jgi:hypothetical protein